METEMSFKELLKQLKNTVVYYLNANLLYDIF